MKKFICMLLTVLLLASLTVLPALATDNYANPWTLPLNTTVKGIFDDDKIKTADYYVITTPQDGALTLQVNGGVSMKLHVILFDTDKTTAIIRSEVNLNTPSVSFPLLAAGTYYAEVWWRENGGSYTLTNTFTPQAAANDTEPNTYREWAQPLALGTSSSGHLGYYSQGLFDQWDFYKVHVTAAGTLDVTVQSEKTLSFDLFMAPADNPDYVVSSDLELNKPANSIYHVSTTVTKAGDYFVSLKLNHLGKYGSYTIQAQMAAATVTATPTQSRVYVNGKEVAFDAYTIDGNNYFKIRDLAMALNGSNKQFSVGWDGSKNAISLVLNQPYTPVGGELAVSGSKSSNPGTRSNSKVYLNGAEIVLAAYTISQSNYVKLRDLMRLMNVGVLWDGTTSSIGIDTSKAYTD